MKLHLSLVIMTIPIGITLQSQAASTAQNWLNWTYPTSTTAIATGPGGTITLSVSGPSTSISGSTVQFIGDASASPAAAPVHNTNAAENWSYTLDFSGYADTTDMVLAFGNIGNSNANISTYQLSAIDTANAPIPISNFFGMMAFDYIGPGPLTFNDTLSVNTSTGVFSVTPVIGQNDGNSNMLLMTMPTGVKSITVTTQSPSGLDTHAVMLGVPEPSSLMLSGFGLVSLLLIRRRRAE